MNESDTRLKKIDPALHAAGWGVVEGSDIFTEQRAYIVSPGRIVTKAKRNPDKLIISSLIKALRLELLKPRKMNLMLVPE